MRYIDRKKLNIFVIVFSLILFILFIKVYFDMRENFYREYLRHKEVMFLLANYKTEKKAQVNEEYLKNVVINSGAEFKSFGQTANGFEIKGRNLKGSRIPKLIYSLESDGLEVVKFRAVDNTGSGIYDFELIVR